MTGKNSNEVFGTTTMELAPRMQDQKLWCPALGRPEPGSSAAAFLRKILPCHHFNNELANMAILVVYFAIIWLFYAVLGG